jgi:hypothetical protein
VREPQRARAAWLDALAAFAVSRLAILAVLAVSSTARDFYPHGWDAGIYAQISDVGYLPPDVPRQVTFPAFFPLLPAAEHVLSAVAGSAVFWGSALAIAGSVLGLVALHLVTADRFGPGTARWAVWLVALFPFSYVLSTGYTEGPFLLFSVLAYTLTRRGDGTASAAGAGVFAFLAALVRPAGFFLAPMFAYDAWRDGRRRAACLSALAGSLAAPLLFFAYLRHLRGDFLASIHAQQEGWHRSTNPLAAIGDLARYTLRSFTTPHGTHLVYLVGVPLCLAGLVILWRRGVHDGPFWFALFAFLGPLATGSADSLPRFAMATFPYAWAGGLAMEGARPRTRMAVLALSAVALVGALLATYVKKKLAP